MVWSGSHPRIENRTDILENRTKSVGPIRSSPDLGSSSCSPPMRKWIQLMDEEIHTIEKNDTWVLASLPPAKKPIGVKWLYKTKYKHTVVRWTITKPNYSWKAIGKVHIYDYFKYFIQLMMLTFSKNPNFIINQTFL